jgi:integrase/recombinase XerD
MENIQTTNNQLLSEFLASLKTQKYSVSTIAAYKSDIQKLIETASVPVNQIEPPQIENHISTIAKSGSKYSSLKRNIISLKEYFNYLVDRGVVSSNPVSNVHISPVHQDILGSDIIVKMFKYLIDRQQTESENIKIRYLRDQLVLLLMLYHGVRQYQLSSLKLSQIQQHGDHLILKLNESQTVKFSGFVLVKLREYLSLRNSNSNTIILEPITEKPVTSVQALLHELNYALNLTCTTISLYHTYLHLRNNSTEMKKLFNAISSSNISDSKIQKLNPNVGLYV